jgi:hypothetical protein
MERLMNPKSKRKQSASVIPLRRAVDAVAAPEVGRLVGVSEGGVLEVECEEGAGPVPARAFAGLDPATLRAAVERRAEVFLFFAGGDRRRPIIAGVLAPEGPVPQGPFGAKAGSLPECARVDGKRVLVEGQDEIVFRCGKASITLRRNGKVVIRGTRIESVSRGLQRVLGAAVEIN